jgi:hypothetical protein
MSEWPSGLRRQTQECDDSCLLVGGSVGNSGPRMRAGVRIPFLTKNFLTSYNKCSFYVHGFIAIMDSNISGDIAQW